MADRLQELKDRVVMLQGLKAKEETQPRPSVRYLDDLNLSIKSCEDQIQQWTFARGNPLVMINGVAVQ